MEHKIIGSIAMSVLFIALIAAGILLGRRYADAIPTQKLRRLLLICVLVLLVASVGEYYVDNFMSDGKTSVRQIFFSDLPVCALFMSIWLGAYLGRRQKLTNAQI